MLPVLAQPFAEIDQRGLVRHCVLPSQPDEVPPDQAVTDRFFTLRVGQDVAVLEQAHLGQDQRARTAAFRWLPDTSRPTRGAVSSFCRKSFAWSEGIELSRSLS